MSDLNALLARLEGADGPDRDLDAEIASSLTPEEYRDTETWDREKDCFVGEDDDGYTFKEPPHVTESIDAALALVEKKLPGWWWQAAMIGGASGSGKSFFHVNFFGVRPEEWTYGINNSLPLAILIALVKALIAHEATQDA